MTQTSLRLDHVDIDRLTRDGRSPQMQLRKAHELQRTSVSRIEVLPLSHRMYGEVIRDHLNALHDYVVVRGRGWGGSVEYLEGWKRLAAFTSMGATYAKRLSVAWHAVEAAARSGGLSEPGREVALAARRLKQAGLRPVTESFRWNANGKSMLEFVPPLLARATFPVFRSQPFKDRLFLRRSTRGHKELVLLRTYVQDSDDIDWKSERLVVEH